MNQSFVSSDHVTMGQQGPSEKGPPRMGCLDSSESCFCRDVCFTTLDWGSSGWTRAWGLLSTSKTHGRCCGGYGASPTHRS